MQKFPYILKISISISNQAKISVNKEGESLRDDHDGMLLIVIPGPPRRHGTREHRLLPAFLGPVFMDYGVSGCACAPE